MVRRHVFGYRGNRPQVFPLSRKCTLATMLMKIKQLTRKTRKCLRLYLVDIEAVSGISEAEGGRQGELKMKGYPTMLLKTKENKSDILNDPTMFMKKNNLIVPGHDVDHIKRT
jgi:hypothetical protein